MDLDQNYDHQIVKPGIGGTCNSTDVICINMIGAYIQSK
jgi:hypothetical protein